MKYNVLVIDDQLDNEFKITNGGETTTRRQEYMLFFERIQTEDSTFEIALDFAEKPSDFQSKVRRKDYSAVIVDAVLNEFGDWKNENFTINDVLEGLGNEIPIAIISSHWNDSNSKEINKAWDKPNCRTFLHWRDIQQGGDGQFRFAATAFKNMVADKKNIDIATTLEANESIRILHISDIQLGGFSQERAKADIAECVEKILIYWKEKPPTFIALTGDVAEYGDPSQYKAARNWIADLYDRLTKNRTNSPARNILYVPGNHDVNLRLAAAARVKLEKNLKDELTMVLGDKPEHEELLQYAYMPFRNFLSEVSDCPLLTQDINDQHFAWIEARYRHLGVIFYGVNTAQPANAFGIPSRKVSPNVLTAIGDKLQVIIEDCDDIPPLIIGLGHHCPVEASGDRAVENPDAFEQLFKRKVKTALFLHGHTHGKATKYTNDGAFRLVRNCAATFTKEAQDRQKDHPRGFSLLELKRKNHRVISLHVASFGWIGGSILSTDSNTFVCVRNSDGMFNEPKHI